MIISVASNLQGEIGSREVFRLSNEPAPATLPDDPKITAPVSGELTITHEPEGLAVRGYVDTTVMLACDRDLTEFDQDIHANVDGLYASEPDVDQWQLDGSELDLGPLVRESIMLSLPPHPLCRPDCTIPLEY